MSFRRLWAHSVEQLARQVVSAAWADSAAVDLARGELVQVREVVVAALVRALGVGVVVLVPVVAGRATEATRRPRRDRHRLVHLSPPESQIG
jgi:hypothetical protein